MRKIVFYTLSASFKRKLLAISNLLKKNYGGVNLTAKNRVKNETKN